jgi:hypothetical protein
VTIRTSVRRVLAGAALAAAIVVGFYTYQFVVVGTAYSAHMLCSGLFVSGRTSESVLSSDLGADDLAPLRVLTTEVDANARRVRAHLFGMASRTAVHRSDFGCVVEERATTSDVPAVARPTERDVRSAPAHKSNELSMRRSIGRSPSPTRHGCLARARW